MSGLENVPIKSKLFLLAAFTIVGTLVLGLFAYHALETVRIGGAMDRQIQLNNDVNAQFAPSDLNILESRIIVYQLLQLGYERSRLMAVRQLTEQRQNYEDARKELLLQQLACSNNLQKNERPMTTRCKGWRRGCPKGR